VSRIAHKRQFIVLADRRTRAGQWMDK